MSPALVLILGTAAGAVPASTDAQDAPPRPTAEARDACRSADTRDILVCAQRQPYRVDPNVMESGRQAETNSRSATSAVPTAQAACLSSPIGCTKDLSSLDLANVAFVLGIAAVRAAQGRDWSRAFRPAGPDEYQLYQQVKQKRAAEADERAATQVKRQAEDQERKAHAAPVGSK